MKLAPPSLDVGGRSMAYPDWRGLDPGNPFPSSPGTLALAIGNFVERQIGHYLTAVAIQSLTIWSLNSCGREVSGKRLCASHDHGRLG